MTTTPTIIRPPIRATTEHLFQPLVWFKPVDGEWVVEVDWSESYSYSYDNATEETIEHSAKVGPDIDTVDAVITQLIASGALPKGDVVASLPWVDIDFDPMAYFA